MARKWYNRNVPVPGALHFVTWNVLNRSTFHFTRFQSGRGWQHAQHDNLVVWKGACSRSILFPFLFSFVDVKVWQLMARKWSNRNVPGALHFVTWNVLNRSTFHSRVRNQIPLRERLAAPLNMTT